MLRLIDKYPARRAPDLAASIGRDPLAFKRDVLRLKELGLAESLEVGYRLSPRGRAVLRRSRVTDDRHVRACPAEIDTLPGLQDCACRAHSSARLSGLVPLGDLPAAHHLSATIASKAHGLT